MLKFGNESIGNPAKERQPFWNFVGAEVNRLIKMLVESTLEAERDAAAGCEWHERSEDRKAYRNGCWRRTLNTVDGPVEIRPPRLRGVEVAHSCFEQYRRHTDRLVVMVTESLIRGHTTRHTKAFVEWIAGVSLSPQTVSNILARLDAQARDGHDRRLRGTGRRGGGAVRGRAASVVRGAQAAERAESD
jgi:transposase-like protein